MSQGPGPLISLLVAATENGVIGRDNGMPWHLPDDLKRFKALTLSKPVLMGRRTFESIGRPLPGRTNLVMTRSASWSHPGVTVVADLAAAIRAAGSAPELVVAGGAQVYDLALPLAARIYLTRIHAVIDGDTRLPSIDPARWQEVAREEHPADARHLHALSFVTLETKSAVTSRFEGVPSAMQVLYVHGMGRSPVSGWPLLRRLRRVGMRTHTFGHFVSTESFATIVGRLGKRLMQLAHVDDYALVGHSLGGVLLREALCTLPASVRLPQRLFLLGSPVQVSSVAAQMASNPLYRLLTGDCGSMLGSPQRMAGVGTPAVPVTAVVGIRGWSVVSGLLPREVNDGVVTLSEASAPWLTDVVPVPVTHMLLPSDARVSAVILERLQSSGRGGL